MTKETQKNETLLSDLLPQETNSPQETVDLGKKLSLCLMPGSVLAIYGTLGAGKTHLVKGICEGLGVQEGDISSPTFSLINEYQGEIEIYHFDFYRIEKVDELFDLGYQEYFFGDGISIVEWPEKFPSVLPSNTISIALEHRGPTGRTIREAIIPSEE